MTDIIKDSVAVNTIEKLEYKVKKLKLIDMTLYAVRSKLIDAFARSYLVQNPYGTVLSIGAGLDTRRQRIDNKKATFIEVDELAIMSERNRLFEKDERTVQIVCEPYDKNWITKVGKVNEPVLIIAEGVLPYMTKDEAEAVFKALRFKFSRADIIFDASSTDAVTFTKAKWGIDFAEDFCELGMGINFVGAIHLEDDKAVKALPKAVQKRYDVALTLHTVKLPERILIYKFLDLLEL